MMKKLRWSTIKTRLGLAIGEHQRRRDKKEISPGVKRLIGWAAEMGRREGTSKAEPITERELPALWRKIDATAMEKLMTEVLVVSCVRFGNLKELKHIKYERERSWTFLLRNHKTRAKGIMGGVTLKTAHFSPRLKKFLSKSTEGKLLFGEVELKEFQSKLNRLKVRTHSFRRGGILQLFKRGVALDRIRTITRHTSDGQLLEYLDGTEIE